MDSVITAAAAAVAALFAAGTDFGDLILKECADAPVGDGRVDALFGDVRAWRPGAPVGEARGARRVQPALVSAPTSPPPEATGTPSLSLGLGLACLLSSGDARHGGRGRFCNSAFPEDVPSASPLDSSELEGSAAGSDNSTSSSCPTPRRCGSSATPAPAVATSQLAPTVRFMAPVGLLTGVRAPLNSDRSSASCAATSGEAPPLVQRSRRDSTTPMAALRLSRPFP
mmetsp:Transcript_97338/g.275105  ORF Transcript_97338/g.275105 Transcript_97338/m.275105 type:complete len:227 (+) Transcript_97338:445-1125(+)